jgi:Putative transposase
MRMWRDTVIDHLRNALKAKVLKSDLSTSHVQRLLATAFYSKKHPRWIISISEIESKSHFLRYAARYVRRPPIAMWRLRNVSRGGVTFMAKDTKEGKMVPTKRPLPAFVRMLAAHVPNRYQHAIRYFGLLAPRSKNKTHAGLFLLLGQKLSPRPGRLSWRDSLIKYFGIDPHLDSHGELMHWVRRVEIA